jgi:hypothetical protein
MRIAILAASLCLLMAAPAGAQVEPFPGRTWVVPGDGFVWRASSWPAALPSQMFDFTVYLDEYEELPEALEIEVASAPDLDADGTLADATVIERYEARPLPNYPQVFAARTRPESPWLATPGAYYWQASYEEYEDGEEELYTSSVRSLSIVPAPPQDPPRASAPPAAPISVAAVAGVAPPPPRLAASTARIIVRRAIHAATHRSHRGLTYRCVTTPGAGSCRPSWRDQRFRYRGTLQIQLGAAGINVTFTGTRAARSCTRRCAHAFTWTTTLS